MEPSEPKLQRAEFTGTFREATQFPRQRKKKRQDNQAIELTMISYDAQVGRDCFLSWESFNVCTNHSLQWNVLVGSKSLLVVQRSQDSDLSPTRPARSRPRRGLGLHSLGSGCLART
jgi:hypothetical protein